ncbi:MrcB family domain-containing protein [Streptomyces hydrogenans]|uniref:MrcB family domain-containing protein n=1 Tax=Streptomyces hydrogenans TaxID=1873719 RepID=UPI00332931A9
MSLRDLILDIAAIYNPEGKTSTDRADCALLWGVKDSEGLPLPKGCRAEGFAGKGNMARVPWIGIFQEEINTNPHQGVYLAYLFDADRTTVTLSLQQGVTELSKKDRYGTGKALRRYLDERGATYRRALPPPVLQGWQDGVSLKVRNDQWRPRAYQHADIAARRYVLANLPSEEELARDLEQAVALLSHAVVVDRYAADLSFPTPNEPVVFSFAQHAPETDEEVPFLPGNDQDYVVTLKGGVERRRREHETLLVAFATHAIARSFEAQRKGIGLRDLILSRNDSSAAWLVEVKQIQAGGHRKAVREAVAQLLEYRHAYYRQHDRPDPHLLAVFSGPIGGFGPYLESLGIAAVWPVADAPLWWAGTSSAVEWGLVSAAT